MFARPTDLQVFLSGLGIDYLYEVNLFAECHWAYSYEETLCLFEQKMIDLASIYPFTQYMQPWY